MGRGSLTLLLCAAYLVGLGCMPDWPPEGVDDDSTGDDDDSTAGDDDSTAGDDDTTAGDDDTTAGDDDTVTNPPTWVLLSGGTYDMGSEDGEDHEQPVHPVELHDFEIGRTEVTVEQYRACVDDNLCEEPNEDGQWCHWNVAGREQYPVNCVNWQQARDYCGWLGARLLTEAEWEYAARGQGQDVDYPWGNAPATCDLAVMDDPAAGGNGCGDDTSLVVCSRSPDGDTAQGVCDMAGNVWEWVADLYHDSYEGAPPDGSVWEEGGTAHPVTRGGSNGNEADKLTTTYRDWAEVDRSIPGLGIRCARTP